MTVNHQGQEEIYTDGSKSEDGVGCAIVVNNEVFQAKLPDSASIFTAEMTAIEQALEIVYNSKKKDFVIYSDSKCNRLFENVQYCQPIGQKSSRMALLDN